MEPYVAFSHDAILEGATPQDRSPEGQTWAPIPVETEVAPIEEPRKELAWAEILTEEGTTIEEPIKELTPTEILMKRPPHI